MDSETVIQAHLRHSRIINAKKKCFKFIYSNIITVKFENKIHNFFEVIFSSLFFLNYINL